MNRFRFDKSESYTRSDLKLLNHRCNRALRKCKHSQESRCRITSQSAYKLHLILSERVGEIHRRPGTGAWASFDDLVGAGEDRERKSNSQCFCCLEIEL